MTRLPRRTTPATLTALVLLALGTGAAVVGIRSVADGTAAALPGPLTQLAATTWDAPLSYALGAGLLLLGVVLLAAGLVPGRAVVLALDPLGDTDRAGITRRSVRRAVESAAAGVDGVRSASAAVTQRRVVVRATTDLHDATGLDAAVDRAVAARLAAISLAHSPVVRVRTTAARSADA